jgi:hypothetical protein
MDPSMEMNIQPLGASCMASGRDFTEGDRVASYLVRTPDGAVARYDVLDGQDYAPAGTVVCRWVRIFKPQLKEENAERTLKLNADNLFLTLADPSVEPTPENTRLVQFLALMLERKRLLKSRGRSADGAKNLMEHTRTKQVYEIPAGDLTSEFFIAIREQLTVLVGEPKPKSAAPSEATPA